MQPTLTDLTPEEIGRLVDRNGTECCLSWAAWPEMQLERSKSAACTLTDIPFPFFNNVFHSRFTDTDVAEGIRSTLARYQKQNVPMFWWTGPATTPANLGEHLLENGLAHGFTAPAMAVDINSISDVETPSSAVVEEVLDEAALQDWCNVMCPVYEFPEFAWEPWFRMLSHLGINANSEYRHFLARVNGMVAATASIYFSDGVAGVSCVATLPEYRRRGIGTAVTVAALRAARAEGYNIGVLFASPMGESIYRQIGFEEYGKGNCYIWSPE
jgi:ribosomal protein S18 acetylase RimI-like enzyme